MSWAENKNSLKLLWVLVTYKLLWVVESNEVCCSWDWSTPVYKQPFDTYFIPADESIAPVWQGSMSRVICHLAHMFDKCIAQHWQDIWVSFISSSLLHLNSHSILRRNTSMWQNYLIFWVPRRELDNTACNICRPSPGEAPSWFLSCFVEKVSL